MAISFPADLLSELRTALSHLGDPAYLENHPLASRIDAVAQAPELTRGQLLQRTLRLGIEALDPGAGVLANSPEARPYQVLRGRYIRGKSMGELAMQLDVGRRQAFRDLRRAVEALAQMLWDGGMLSGVPGSPAAPVAVPHPVTRLRAEVDRLAIQDHQEVSMSELIGHAIESIRPLANSRGIEVHFLVEAEGLRVAVNRVMLRQAVLNLLSHVIPVHQGDTITVRLARLSDQAVVRFAYRAPDGVQERSRPGKPYSVAAQLLETLGIAWTHDRAADGAIHVSVRIPLAHEHKVLIIDDNQGLVRLFGRYLEGQPYRLFAATKPAQALEMLEQVQPAVVILDVMMPDRDGWELLELIRKSQCGRRARILICSIIDDPQLAAALGVDGFLHKPVDRRGLLQALDRLVSTAA